jgi:hypothetical protein
MLFLSPRVTLIRSTLQVGAPKPSALGRMFASPPQQDNSLDASFPNPSTPITISSSLFEPHLAAPHCPVVEGLEGDAPPPPPPELGVLQDETRYCLALILNG